MIDNEAAEIASRLWKAANITGGIVEMIERAEIYGPEVLRSAIIACPDAVGDIAVVWGAEFVSALRQLAMALDRAVCVREGSE